MIVKVGENKRCSLFTDSHFWMLKSWRWSDLGLAPSRPTILERALAVIEILLLGRSQKRRSASTPQLQSYASVD